MVSTSHLNVFNYFINFPAGAPSEPSIPEIYSLNELARQNYAASFGSQERLLHDPPPHLPSAGTEM